MSLSVRPPPALISADFQDGDGAKQVLTRLLNRFTTVGGDLARQWLTAAGCQKVCSLRPDLRRTSETGVPSSARRRPHAPGCTGNFSWDDPPRFAVWIIPQDWHFCGVSLREADQRPLETGLCR